MRIRFFFFNDTATTEIYTLSLHDALPICLEHQLDLDHDQRGVDGSEAGQGQHDFMQGQPDRKSTRLNSSHSQISYAVFCLKKKNPNLIITTLWTAVSRGTIVCFRRPKKRT